MKVSKILTTLTLCAFMLALAQRVLAQQAPQVTMPRMPKDLRMQSTLFDAEMDARLLPVAEARGVLGRRGIQMRKDGKVHVEIVGPQGESALPASVLLPFGGEVEGSWRHRVDAWIPLQRLSEVARILPAGYFLERAQRPEPDEVIGEGPDIINSDSYTPAGQGLTIAVIDLGYAGLTAAINNGDAPAGAALFNYTSKSFEDPCDGWHGTGCVEEAFNHCPNSTWLLYKIDSLTDLGLAVDDAETHGVDVISHSLSWYNTGWDDDSGDACAAANSAASSGILFFTSAGNDAAQHWQGNFNDTNADDWHEFAPGDKTIDILVPGNNTEARFCMSWDTTGGTFDYDLYLYNSTMTAILGWSNNGGNNYEGFSWTNTSASAQTVHLLVFRSSGGITQFELFMLDGFLQQHIVSDSSTASPSNSTDSGVISVGAVRHGDFNSPGGTVGIIRSYSSRGPSNSGMTLPDIVGPTDTSNFTYGSFGGTSCAAPNAAGAACAFLSAHSQYVATATEYLLQQQALVYRDWGSSGVDNTYGYGGIQLVDYAPNTLWISRDFGAVLAVDFLPYYTVEAAHAAAFPGGRLLFIPGGNYPEAVSLTKNLTVETVGPAAILGE